ncbi:sulfatase [bacterium]|nr:sulfatase [bacterium]
MSMQTEQDRLGQILRSSRFLLLAMVLFIFSTGCTERTSSGPTLLAETETDDSISPHLVLDCCADFEKRPVERKVIMLHELTDRSVALRRDWIFKRTGSEAIWLAMKKARCTIPIALNQPLKNDQHLPIFFSVRTQWLETDASIFLNVILNGKMIGRIGPTPTEQTWTWKLEPALIINGSNLLEFHMDEEQFQSLKAIPAFQWLELSVTESTTDLESPFPETCRSIELLHVERKGSELKSLIMCPGTAISFTTHLPSSPGIYFALTSPALDMTSDAPLPSTARVTVNIVGQDRVVAVWQRTLQGNERDRWSYYWVPLGEWSDQHVELTLSVMSDSKHTKNQSDYLVWGHPLVLGKYCDTPPCSETSNNVLLLLIDTLRSDRLGCYGYPSGQTPEIDKFSKQALLFTEVASQAPATFPSVSSLFSGRYPRFSGRSEIPSSLSFSAAQPGNEREKKPITQRLIAPSLSEMKQDQISNRHDTGERSEANAVLPELMKQAGFYTAGISTNPLISRRYEFDRGFDCFDDTLGFGHADQVVADSHALFFPPHPQPFFLYLHFMDPHYPYALPQKDAFPINNLLPVNSGPNIMRNEANYSVLYDFAIRYTDSILGVLFRKLAYQGTLARTFCFLVSDHGEEFRERGHLFHNSSLHKEQISVPLIVSFPLSGPQRGKAGLETSIVGVIDLNPTIQALATANLTSQNEGLPIQSILSQGEPSTRGERDLFGELSNFGQLEEAEELYVRRGPWKLIKPVTQKQGKLYHLEKDPDERDNLAESQSTVVRDLVDVLNTTFQDDAARDHYADQDESFKQDLRALGYLE